MLHKVEVVKRIIWAVLVCIVLIAILGPLYMFVKYSISDPTTLNTFGRPIPLWPNRPTFDVFLYLFKDRDFWIAAGNSTIIAFSTVLVTMVFSIPAGYVLAKKNIPFKRIFLLILISIRLLPEISSVIPITKFIHTNGVVYAMYNGIDSFAELLGNYNNPSDYISIVIVHSLLCLPYVIFIAMTGFECIPKDIEEQASVMGATRFIIFTKILIPIVFPSLIAGIIYTFIGSWNEFIFAHFILDISGNIQTLTLYLNRNLTGAPPQNVLVAIAVCLSVPVVLFSSFIQRYMVKGMVTGSVK